MTSCFFRRILVLLFFIQSCIQVHAQEEDLNIDSLAHTFLNSEQIDLKTFDLLFKELHLMHSEELAHLAEVLLKRSTQQNFPEGIYRAHDAFGFHFLLKGHFNQAFKLLLKAKKFYEQTDNLPYRMRNYYYIGRVYVAMGNLDEAIHWMEKSKQLAEKSPDRNALYVARIDLATIHFRNSNYESGKKLLDSNQTEWSNLTLHQQVDITTLYGNYWLNSNKADKNKAKEMYDLANQMALGTRNHVLIANTYTNLGIYEYEYDIQKSKKYFESSLYHAYMSNYPNKIALDHYNLGFWHYGIEQIDSAMYHFEVSYITAKSVKALDYMLDALEMMIEVERQQGHWEKVDALHEKVREVKTLQYKELIGSYDDLALFEIDDSQLGHSTNQRLNNQLVLGFEKTSFFIIALLSFLVLVLSVSLLIVSRNNQLKTRI